jgi:hypothetical protein
MITQQYERECRTYTRYLIGQKPTKYVIEKYLDFHRTSDAAAPQKFDRFDQFLITFSAAGVFRTRLSDSYVSVFRKDAALRKKLTLVLALLECSPPSFELLDAVSAAGPTKATMLLASGAAQYIFMCALAIIFFTPIRVAMAFSPAPREAAVLER